MRKPKANAYLADDQEEEPQAPQAKRGAYVPAPGSRNNLLTPIGSGFQTQENPPQSRPAFATEVQPNRSFDGFAGFGSMLIPEAHGTRCRGRNCVLCSCICVCILLVVGAVVLALVLTGGSSDSSSSPPSSSPPPPDNQLSPPFAPRASPPPSPPPSPPGAAIVTMMANRLNDRCLQINDSAGRGRSNGARVEMGDCLGTQNQLWRMEDGRLVSIFSEKCLEIVAFNMNNYATLQMFDCGDSVSNQQWTREGDWNVDGNTNAVLRSQMSQKCLEFATPATTTGDTIQMYECNGGQGQQWFPVQS
mmetsp:Transcript_26555/g.57747  ORF Transcript_26555/g.57747 Transcript_26555/m.57747 type:complete len:304 (-) Transcript_26555:194-1105(-)